MFRTITIAAAVLVAAAATATGAVAQPKPKPVDPLAVSVLKGRGWSASRIYDWTQGACSYQVKPASCYLTPAEAKLASERLAESMHLRTQPQEIDPLASSILRDRYATLEGYRPVATTAGSGGFDWGDGLIGSGVTAGILLLGALGAFTLYRRRELAHR